MKRGRLPCGGPFFFFFTYSDFPIWFIFPKQLCTIYHLFQTKMMKILQQQNQIFVGAFADKTIIQRKKRMDPNWPV